MNLFVENLQKTYDKNHKEMTVSQGTMRYKKPNLFRFQDDSSQQLMVNDLSLIHI